jgi:pimeloyl-ACP methyl ester carboxylesterase
LLDRWYRQQATGTFQVCLARLDELGPAEVSQPPAQPYVLVLHGLGRTRYSMRTMANHLRRHGFNAHTVGYPSTQAPIEAHAQSLAQIVRHLPGDGPIHLVGHSMGGLVARTYIDSDPDPRVQRIVMIGTPNQGAQKADFFESIGLIHLVGPAARQLVPGASGITSRLAPSVEGSGVEVGIIAGGGPGCRGYSLLLPADNDGVVTVESTRLPGSTDFCLVRGHHAFLPSILPVRTATERFLRTGAFSKDGVRVPIH